MDKPDASMAVYTDEQDTMDLSGPTLPVGIVSKANATHVTARYHGDAETSCWDFSMPREVDLGVRGRGVEKFPRESA